eukprot:m.10713 g.10713  ORF g.10713 m.10713 type:complete len:232 (+) comp22586_c0_seq2:266-961(+)
MSSFLPFVAHLFFFLFWTYFHYVEFYVIDFPDYGDSGKPCFLCRLRYLTVWSTVSQHVYFLIALFCDLFYTSDTSKEGNRPLLLSLRDFVFTTATCSFGLFIPPVFWTLYSINRDNVYPKFFDGLVPAWMHHAAHTFICILVALEILLVNHKFANVKVSVMRSLLLSATYGIFAFWLRHTDGHFPYGILEKMTDPQVVLFIVGLSVVVMVVQLIARQMHAFIWRQQNTKTD